MANTRTTEILNLGATKWLKVGDLPRPRNGMRATNVNNMIYLLGKYVAQIALMSHLRLVICLSRWRYGDTGVQLSIQLDSYQTNVPETR